MAKKYFIGLLIAWGLFTALFAAGVVPIELGRRGSLARALAALLPIALGLALFNTLLLATIPGPAILWLRGRLRESFAPWHAALLGTCSLPVYVLLPWFAFREHNETLIGLLRFWWRVPGELLLHTLPAALAGAAFGACVVGRRRTSAAGEQALAAEGARREEEAPRLKRQSPGHRPEKKRHTDVQSDAFPDVQ